MWDFANSNAQGHFVSLIEGLIVSDQPVGKRDHRPRTLRIDSSELCKRLLKRYIGFGVNTGCCIYAIKPKREGKKKEN